MGFYGRIGLHISESAKLNLEKRHSARFPGFRHILRYGSRGWDRRCRRRYTAKIPTEYKIIIKVPE